MVEKGGSRGMPDLSSRAGTSPIVEIRDGRRYEERIPNRVVEEDFIAPKFQEHRSTTSKKYDDYYAPTSPRRSSGRMPDERRKGRDWDDDRDNGRHYRQAMKEAEKKANHGHQKKKDKDKKKDREAKFSTRRAPYVEDDDSGSDITERYHPSRHEPAPKHRHEEFRRRDHDEVPRRNSKRDDSNLHHDTEPKGHDAMGYESKANVAMNYIQMSREGGGTIEIEPRRPSAGGRQFFFEARPSMPHNLASGENGRRSSARARESRRNSPVRKDRLTEIVEPPSRKFSLPTASSDPRSLKHAVNSIRKDSLRASTMGTTREEWHVPLPRADSMPTRRTEHPSASSRLRPMDMDDSESSDSDRYQSKSRRNRASEDEERSGIRTYLVFRPAEDGHRDRDWEREGERERDISPRSRRPTDRPSASSRAPSRARVPPQRAASFAAAYSAEHIPSPRPPPLSRAETARPPPSQSRQPLYGEVRPSDGYRIVNQQPRLGPDDVRYSPHSLRETGRDAYPYESSRNRPTMSGRETRTVY